MFEQLRKASQSIGERPPIQVLPVSRRGGRNTRAPLVLFALAIFFACLLYSTEYSLRQEAQKGLLEAQDEIARMRPELKKIQTLESDKSSLEQERDHYKEESWDLRLEIEKLKQETAAR